MQAAKEAERVEDLELKSKAMELLIDDKNSELIREREVLARTNQQLINLQSDFVIHKLTERPPLSASQKPKYSRTCSIFYSASKNKSTVVDNPSKMVTVDPSPSRKDS